MFEKFKGHDWVWWVTEIIAVILILLICIAAILLCVPALFTGLFVSQKLAMVIGYLTMISWSTELFEDTAQLIRRKVREKRKE